jgi:hypothetical protein
VQRCLLGVSRASHGSLAAWRYDGLRTRTLQEEQRRRAHPNVYMRQDTPHTIPLKVVSEITAEQIYLMARKPATASLHIAVLGVHDCLVYWVTLDL